MTGDRVFDLTPEEQRRMPWRNLSPVVETRHAEGEEGGVAIARHADGRFTVVEETTP